jgi:hypothetical protein
MVSAMSSRPIALAAALLLAAAGPAVAQGQTKAPAKPAPAQPKKEEPPKDNQPQRLGGNQGWSAYAYADGKGKVCYLVGEPAKKEPVNLRRDRVNALVTHNTNDKTSNVVSFVEGYQFPERADAELDVDGKKFSLFTDKDTAWARDAATDKAIVAALVKGKQAVVKGASSRGTATTDTYALTGFGETLALIDKACSVKR